MSRTLRCIKFLLFLMVGIGLLGWLLMFLWNWLMPELFTGAHTISYIQALGLFVLCRLLFGSLRKGGHWQPGMQRFRQRWNQMDDDERRKCREALRGFRQGWGRRDNGNGNGKQAGDNAVE